MSKYTWVVCRDERLGHSSDAIGRIGPPGAKDRARFDHVIVHGAHFRLLNRDGEVCYLGYIEGDYSGREPLDDFGLENSCTDIQYERFGEWVSA